MGLRNLDDTLQAAFGVLHQSTVSISIVGLKPQHHHIRRINPITGLNHTPKRPRGDHRICAERHQYGALEPRESIQRHADRITGTPGFMLNGNGRGRYCRSDGVLTWRDNHHAPLWAQRFQRRQNIADHRFTSDQMQHLRQI